MAASLGKPESWNSQYDFWRAGGRHLNPYTDFGWPILAGFARVGLLFASSLVGSDFWPAARLGG
jgi:hypothetical protein